MQKIFLTTFLFLAFFIIADAQQLQSPNGNFILAFSLQKDGTPTYSLMYKGKAVLKSGRLGLELKNDKVSLLNGFAIKEMKTSSFNETWKPVWGEVKTIRNNYNEIAITLNQKATERQLIIRFRLFDDGLGFRYE